jgi:hypothetical protein
MMRQAFRWNYTTRCRDEKVEDILQTIFKKSGLGNTKRLIHIVITRALVLQGSEPMSQFELPKHRIMSKAFGERGRHDVVKIDVLPVREGELLKVTFESVGSPWRQGAWLKTDRGLVVAQQLCVSVELWYDTAPREVLLECRTNDGCLHLHNVWDRGLGSNSQAWSSGMLIEELPNGRRYRCNDIGFDTDFSKLIFRIERAQPV